MRIISWNVNGIRAWLEVNFEHLITQNCLIFHGRHATEK